MSKPAWFTNVNIGGKYCNEQTSHFLVRKVVTSETNFSFFCQQTSETICMLIYASIVDV